MNAALLAGIFAGYAIAVPVGVIAVLIIEAGMAGGLRRGFAAGAGAATVDLIYCVTALVIGGALNQILASALLPLQVLSGVVLISIGVRGLYALWRGRRGATLPALCCAHRAEPRYGALLPCACGGTPWNRE